MNAALPELSVRRWLAHETDDLHQALHHHPDLGKLAQPDLDLATYLQALSHMHRVFSSVETQRSALGCWPQFSVVPWITALSSDLGATAPSSNPAPLNDPVTCLGALYVLHGSAFGGRIIAINVAKELPEAPRKFYETAVSTSVWRKLNTELEKAYSDAERARLREGALETFLRVKAFAAMQEATPTVAASGAA